MSWSSVRPLLVVGLLSGCIYPELSTPLGAPPSGAVLEPDPPSDLVFVAFDGASLDSRTPDGRTWSGGAPDTYARLTVDGENVLQTPVAHKTLNPRWPNQPEANYPIKASAKVRVELWDDNGLVDSPICVAKLDDFAAQARLGNLTADCAHGIQIDLHVEPAHAKYGIGIYYEAHGDGIFITRVASNSPASRAGIGEGDLIVELQGKRVSAMKSGEARKLIETQRRKGLKVVVRSAAGKTIKAEIKDGPIYLVSGKDDGFGG